MGKLIIRNDDVNPNTDLLHLREIYDVISEVLPEVEIWSSVTLFARSTDTGAVYEGVPFKYNQFEWFLPINKFFSTIKSIRGSRVVSHGLFHINHAKLSDDAQLMSILPSCSYLNTNIFVPPFNKYNFHTEEICMAHDIRLIKTDKVWKNFEYEDFTTRHRLWYFHSWRWKPERLRKVLYESHSRNMG